MVRRLVVPLLIVLAFAVVADRAASMYAAHRVAATVRNAEGLPSTPGIAIHGVPFLTQLVGGTYEDLEATIVNLRRNNLNIDRIDVHLHGARVPFGDVLGGDVRRVPVVSVNGSVRVGYDDLASASRHDVHVSYAGDGQVRVTRNVPGGAGNTVVGIGDVGLRGQRVVVRITKVRTADGGVLEGPAGRVAAAGLGFSVRVPGLPFGIELQSAKADESGITLAARGSHVTLVVHS